MGKGSKDVLKSSQCFDGSWKRWDKSSLETFKSSIGKTTRLSLLILIGQHFSSKDYSDAGENHSDVESEIESSSQSEKTTEKHKEEIESTSKHNPIPEPCSANSDYGCDHECSMVKYDYDVNPVVQW